MNRFFVTLGISIFLITLAQAQNLVPNPSFETYTGCPGGNSAISNGFVPNWNRPPGSIITPDLFTPCTSSGTSCLDFNTANNCVGSSAAFHGTSYAGILWYYTAGGGLKEYIQAQLTAFCTGGTVYRASYRAKLGNLCRYGSNRLGLYISAAAVNQAGNAPIIVTPTVERPGQVLDKVNWTLVSGTFTALGTERFITIGNFNTDASTSVFDFGANSATCLFASSAAYYMIDSVIVQAAVILPVEVARFDGKARSEGDLLSWEVLPATPLSELWLEHGTDGEHFAPIASWRNPSATELKSQFLYADPVAGPNYYRLGWADYDGEFSVSEVVQIQHGGFDFMQLALSPNPSDARATVEFAMPEGQSVYAWKLTTASGAVVQADAGEATIGRTQFEIATSELAAGIYLLQVRCGSHFGLKRFVVAH
jgi:hypothetical protein